MVFRVKKVELILSPLRFASSVANCHLERNPFSAFVKIVRIEENIPKTKDVYNIYNPKHQNLWCLGLLLTMKKMLPPIDIRVELFVLHTISHKVMQCFSNNQYANESDGSNSDDVSIGLLIRRAQKHCRYMNSNLLQIEIHLISQFWHIDSTQDKKSKHKCRNGGWRLACFVDYSKYCFLFKVNLWLKILNALHKRLWKPVNESKTCLEKNAWVISFISCRLSI